MQRLDDHEAPEERAWILAMLFALASGQLELRGGELGVWVTASIAAIWVVTACVRMTRRIGRRG